MDDMQDPTVYRELGEHTARLKALEASQLTMNAKLDVLLERSATERGSRSTLWKIGGASSAGGGLLVAIATWWVEHFGPRGGTP